MDFSVNGNVAGYYNNIGLLKSNNQKNGTQKDISLWNTNNDDSMVYTGGSKYFNEKTGKYDYELLSENEFVISKPIRRIPEFNYITKPLPKDDDSMVYTGGSKYFNEKTGKYDYEEVTGKYEIEPQTGFKFITIGTNPKYEATPLLPENWYTINKPILYYAF